jgi:ATP-dependent Lon protease
MHVEATLMAGQGPADLTGSLGEVMKESAQAALSYIRTPGAGAQIAPERFRDYDLHIHVPAGAIPKDGPSRRHCYGYRPRVGADVYAY